MPFGSLRVPGGRALSMPSATEPDPELLEELLRGYGLSAPPAAPPPRPVEPPPIDQTTSQPPPPPPRPGVRLDAPPQHLLMPPLEETVWEPHTSYRRRSWVDDMAPAPEPTQGQGREVPPMAPVTSDDVRTAPSPGTLSAENHWGAIEPGNIDLRRRPHVQNPDGSVSTVYSMGVQIDGKQYLIPLVSDDGRIMTPDEGVAEFRRTGKHLGVYASPAASDRAAQAIHEDQEKHPPENTLAAGPDAQAQGGAAMRPISVLVDGKHYVVPSIGEDGRQLSVNEAIAELRRTGRHYGSYATTEESERAAEALRSGAATPLTSNPPTVQQPQPKPSPPARNLGVAPAPAITKSDTPDPGTAGPWEIVGTKVEQPAERSALDEYTDELLRRPKNYAASTLSRIAPAQSKGTEPDFYGYDDESGYSIDERVRRAGEAYRPQQRSTRWEDEFLARHLRPEDAAIRRRSMALEFFSGADRAEQFRKEMYDRQGSFDTGQAQARGRDKAESQIDRGLAEAISSMGILSPEQAGRLTYDSPIVEAFTKGAYKLGAELQQQELERDKLRYGMLDKYAQGEQKEQGDLFAGAQRQETARLMAEGQKVTEEDRQGAMRGAIMMAYGIPKDVAERVVATYGQDLTGVPEQFKTQVQSILEVGNIARNRTDLRTLMTMVSQLAKGPAQTGEAITRTQASNYYGSSNVNETVRLRGIVRTAIDAEKAWKALKPHEKDLYVKLDRNQNIADQIKAMTLPPGTQVNVARLEALNGLFLSMRSGLTQTPAETLNVAREQGLTVDGWLSLGRDSSVYGDFLRRAKKFYGHALDDRRKMLRPPNATKR